MPWLLDRQRLLVLVLVHDLDLIQEYVPVSLIGLVSIFLVSTVSVRLANRYR